MLALRSPVGILTEQGKKLVPFFRSPLINSTLNYLFALLRARLREYGSRSTAATRTSPLATRRRRRTLLRPTASSYARQQAYPHVRGG